MTDIKALVDGVIGREGGYTNNPADKGGPTNWGVTEQVARAYGYQGDMKALPRETASAIYIARYWTAPNFFLVDERYPAVAAEMFDAGVNMGPGAASGFLQRALNLLNRGATDYPDIPVDNSLGALTLHSLDAYRKTRGDEGGAVVLCMVRAFRTCRYASIAEANPTQETFEYGWIAREVRTQ